MSLRHVRTCFYLGGVIELDLNLTSYILCERIVLIQCCLAGDLVFLTKHVQELFTFTQNADPLLALRLTIDSAISTPGDCRLSWAGSLRSNSKGVTKMSPSLK